MWVARPREPEETDGQQGAADNHGRQPVFGDDAALFLDLAGKVGLGDDGDGDGAAENADEDAQEGKLPDAVIPAALLLERDWVRNEAEVDDSVDQGHVESDEDEYRLLCK